MRDNALRVNEVNKSSTFFQKFYQDLKNNGLSGSNGWPQKLKKVSLTNGSINGTKNGYESQLNLHIQGRRLFRTLLAEFKYYNLPATGQNAEYFKGVVTKTGFLYIVNIFPDPYRITNTNINGCMDVVQGSIFDAANIMREEFVKAFEDKSLKVQVLQEPIPNTFNLSSINKFG